MVRWTQSTWAGNQQTVTHLGAFRPAVQVRRYLKSRVTNAPQFYFVAGGYGVVPSAYTRSDTFTESEKVTFDEASNEDKARIAGFGGELGAGVELVFENGISVGVRTGLNLHRSFELDEDAATFSSWLTTESAFTLGFLF